MRGRDFIAEERSIGKKYAIELRNSFKKQISVLDKHTGDTFKAGYRVRFRQQMLQSVAVKTTKVPFINYYGVNKQRAENTYHSKSGRMFTRKSHPFKLHAKIKDLHIPINIVNGLADEIGELRGDQVLTEASKNFQIR